MNKKNIIIGALGIGLLWWFVRNNSVDASQECPGGFWDEELQMCMRMVPAPQPPDPKVPAGPNGMGDIDMDGWVSRWDYDLVQQIRFGQGEFTEEQVRRADINHDGVVSLSDYSDTMLIMTGHKIAE